MVLLLLLLLQILVINEENVSSERLYLLSQLRCEPVLKLLHALVIHSHPLGVLHVGIDDKLDELSAFGDHAELELGLSLGQYLVWLLSKWVNLGRVDLHVDVDLSNQIVPSLVIVLVTVLEAWALREQWNIEAPPNIVGHLGEVAFLEVVGHVLDEDSVDPDVLEVNVAGLSEKSLLHHDDELVDAHVLVDIDQVMRLHVRLEVVAIGQLLS